MHLLTLLDRGGVLERVDVEPVILQAAKRLSWCYASRGKENFLLLFFFSSRSVKKQLWFGGIGLFVEAFRVRLLVRDGDSFAAVVCGSEGKLLP